MPVLQAIRDMRERACLVLLGGTRRDRHGMRDIGHLQSLQHPEHEHVACPFGQFGKRTPQRVRDVLTRQDAVGREIRTFKREIVDWIRQSRAPRLIAPGLILQDIGRSDEDEAVMLANAVRVLQPT